MAMEARCYRGGDHRTRMNEMKMTGKDVLAFLGLVLFLGVIIAERVLI